MSVTGNEAESDKSVPDESNPFPMVSFPASGVVESIQELYKLYQQGALTDDEFTSAKAHVLRLTGTPSNRPGSADSSGSARQPCCHRKRSKGSRDSRGSRASINREMRTKHSSGSSSSSSAMSDFMIAQRANVWHLLASESDTENTTAAVAVPVAEEASSSSLAAAPGERTHPSARPTLEPPAPSSPGPPHQRYGTFLSQRRHPRVSVCVVPPPKRERVQLRPSHEVRVEYFNCLGASGDRFSDVKLREEEIRSPLFLRKRVPQPSDASGFSTIQSEGDFSSVLLGDERKLADEATGSSTSTNSDLEMCLNWYWVDMVGRDASRRKYNAALRLLTRRFNICETFLTDRDHWIVLPQISASPEIQTQFLICLRVATPQIALDDDSIYELTNRWIMVVDLNQKLVITIHRVDCASIANLRHQWASLMKGNDISFQEFLLKLLHDAVNTYQSSLDVHTGLLDLCETKLFVSGRHGSHSHHLQQEKKPRNKFSNVKVLSHFSNSTHSPFLLQLLDYQNTKPMDKGVMNMFLYHLHRRTNVQYRMLSITQTVLAESFTKLRLCSKEHANQMSASCIELMDKALEVRDEAKTLLNLHISLQSFRSNELMAVLTKFSVFFTPCSFLAAVYGMNFPRIPEFRLEYGYYCYWVVCFGICVLIYIYMGRLGLLH